MKTALSPEQEYAFERFKLGDNLFITGPGGTGKTKLIRNIFDFANSKEMAIQVCAMTGCASILLNCGAKTLHSWSGIKLGKGAREKIVADIIRNRRLSSAWRKIKVLIVDEVSMMSLKIFNLCDAIGRAIRKKNKPFGGIQVIFTGDFYQLPPVGTPGEPDTELFCFESAIWKTVFSPENHIQLTTVFRQKDPIYINILNEIRQGQLSEENKTILQNRVKREYDAEANGNCVLTKLFPIRSKADYVNQAQYAKIEDEEIIMPCIRNINCKTIGDTEKPIDFDVIQLCHELSQKEREQELERLIANTCVEKMALKKGAAVMCTTNLDMDSEICNGSQGVVIDFSSKINEDGSRDPVVKFSNGVIRTIKKHTWQSEEYPIISVSQYPLCLAWALTIHKIQGATMSMAEMDLGFNIFEYGQTYVALSRIQSLDGLYLSAFHAHRIKANPKVKGFYDALPKVNYVDELAKLRESIAEKIEYDKKMAELAKQEETRVFDFDKYKLTDDSGLGVTSMGNGISKVLVIKKN